MTMPARLKEMKGTLRPSRENKSEPQPTQMLGDPPDHLGKSAVAEWNRVAPELTTTGVAFAIDAGTLAAYCCAFGRWVDAEKEFIAQGSQLVVETKTGARIPNPLLGVANKSRADAVTFAKVLGMNPVARAKVVASPKTDEDDLWAAFD